MKHVFINIILIDQDLYVTVVQNMRHLEICKLLPTHNKLSQLNTKQGLLVTLWTQWVRIGWKENYKEACLSTSILPTMSIYNIRWQYLKSNKCWQVKLLVGRKIMMMFSFISAARFTYLQLMLKTPTYGCNIISPKVSWSSILC